MEYLYLACLFVSIGMLFWLKLFDVRGSMRQFITVLIVVISNFGYYYLAISTNIEEAILAQKIVYVGGIFLPVFYFLTVLEICQVKISKLYSMACMLVQCIIYGFVCTIGSNGLFYKSVSTYTNKGVVLLKKVYGPLHILYPLTMYCYLFAAFSIAIYCLLKKSNIDRRGIIEMVLLGACAVGVYVIEKTFDVEYEIIPITYIILMLGAFIPIYDSNLYTVNENTEIIDEQLGKLGFLTFDRKNTYKGCNDFMAHVFPELANYRVGQKIDNCSPELNTAISQIVKFEENTSNKHKRGHKHCQLEPFLINDKYYSGTIHAVTNSFGKLKGYTIELRDETEHYRTLELKERYNEELAHEVDEKTKRIRSIQQKTILGMARMVESRDLSTGGHIKRTSDVVRIFSEKLVNINFGLSKRFLQLVVRSAPMHDLGKIGVDDAVLRKQGRFTDEEYEKMKKHSEIGYHMVSEILSEVEEPDFVSVAENVAHYHHEKVDGKGYPDGLKGDEIPIEARIMALADVFDALVSKRCYKEAFSYDKAFSIIEKDSGTHFDEKLAKVFLTCRKELVEYYERSEE